MTDHQWANLGVPIGLAFLFHSTRAGRVLAVYPSPGGAIESQPLEEAWIDLLVANPALRDFEPDTEALLVNRLDTARRYYRASIDDCYRIVGLVRFEVARVQRRRRDVVRA